MRILPTLPPPSPLISNAILQLLLPHRVSSRYLVALVKNSLREIFCDPNRLQFSRTRRKTGTKSPHKKQITFKTITSVEHGLDNGRRLWTKRWPSSPQPNDLWHTCPRTVFKSFEPQNCFLSFSICQELWIQNENKIVCMYVCVCSRKKNRIMAKLQLSATV